MANSNETDNGVMNNPAPPVYKETAAQIIEFLRNDLNIPAMTQTGKRAAPGAGDAMINLFGRLADLVIARLNQVPENHFRAFLNEAGVDLLPPQPARTEITFFPAKDAAGVIHVPAGTQVSAKKTDTRPEIIFETERDLNVVGTDLVSCIAVDPVNMSDRTSEARGETVASFAAFSGEKERERVFYFADDDLFTFADAESRGNESLILTFNFAEPGRADIDGWEIRWSYSDGKAWLDLPNEDDELKTVINDGTGNFMRDGEVAFRDLPELKKYEFDKTSGAWLACRLTGGEGREHLPVIKSVKGRRDKQATYIEKPVEAAFSAIHNGTAFIPLDPKGEFFPLGPRPERLDAFYLQVDGNYFKAGATLRITFELKGLNAGETSSQINKLDIEWAYSSNEGWTQLDKVSNNLAMSGENRIDFAVNHKNEPGTTNVGNQEGVWLRARINSGGYGLDIDPANIWKAPEVRAPSISKMKAFYSGLPVSSKAEHSLTGIHCLVNQSLSAVDASGEFSPFAGPFDFPALFLGFSKPFPEGEWVQLLLEVDEARLPGDDLPALIWEYLDGSGENWGHLPVSDLSSGMVQRGYVGFYGPKAQGKAVLFGKEACWLRVRPHLEPPVANTPAKLISNSGTAESCVISLDASASISADGLNIARYMWRLAPPVAEAGAELNINVTGDEATVMLDASRSGDGIGGALSEASYKWSVLSTSYVAALPQIEIITDAQEATISLDADGSFAADGSPPRRFIWNEEEAGKEKTGTAAATMTGNPPTALAEMAILTQENDEARVCLDASGSFNVFGKSITKYFWHKWLALETERKQPAPVPYLNTIRWNTVPAVNTITIKEEILGSSNGKSGQSFSFLYKPVIQDVVIYVREPDQPSEDDLTAMGIPDNTSQNEGNPDGFPLMFQDTQGTWVLWRRVDDFYSSDNSSRHFIVDTINASITFGDGVRGMRPPIGRDNVKAARYRYPQGLAGNVAAGEVAILRNPTGLLADIKKVINPENAAGGGDSETVEDVRVRGPKSLKHRGKAITMEDYAWLARDASGEVAAAWCLPTRNRDGKVEEGWVTVVIVPEQTGSTDLRPFPRQVLLQDVRQYLESRVLANLPSERHIYVKGPEYIEVRVTARVVPLHPEKVDDVKFAITKRLNEFFHPLSGGPERKGWDLGRDIYLSEVYTEIEAVPGVDHVVDLMLAGSIQQIVLSLEMTAALKHTVLEGGMVSTFDERIRYVLAEPLETGSQDEMPAATGSLLRVPVYGFKVGDRVNIVDNYNTIQMKGVAITGIQEANTSVTLDMNFTSTLNLPNANSLALFSGDERVRLPLAGWEDDGAGKAVAWLEGFAKGENTVCIVSGQRYEELQLLRVCDMVPCRDRIFMPEGHLVYAGVHVIDMVIEEE